MQKTILTFLLGLCGLLVFAAPWAPLDEGSHMHNKPAKSLSNLVDKTLLPQLLARQAPLRYCVEGAAEPDGYASLVEKAYMEWFAKTAQIIRRANRADEFADLLPFLDKPLLFQRQSCARNKQIEDSFHIWADPDLLEQNPASSTEQIRLLLLPPERLSAACNFSAAGSSVACAGAPKQFGAHVVVMPYLSSDGKSAWWSTFLHEVGHTLGVGEGYKLGETKNSPLFGTGFRQGGLMNAQSDEPATFSCDEADALIVFADSVSVPGKPARKGKTARTFQSFCAQDPVWYSDGLVQKREPRSAGDESRFSYTDYHADGTARRFNSFPPDLQGFASSFRLFENLPSAAPSVSGGMTYYPASGGRMLAVQDLEDSGIKRIFTLKDKKLLGASVLEAPGPDGASSVTLLYSKDAKVRRIRKEAIERGTKEDGEPFFVWVQYEGVFKQGAMRDASARVAYIFRDWMVVGLVEPGIQASTTFLLENAPAKEGGQRLQVLQMNDDTVLASGSFSLVNGKVKRLGDLSERDGAYLQKLFSLNSMHDELLAASGTAVFGLGKPAAARDISAKDVLAWSWTAGKLHSQASSVVKNYLSGSPFGLERSRANKNAFGEFSLCFRPAPPIHIATPARGN